VGQISSRLVAQRMRNRIIEVLSDLAEGDSYIETVGVSAWFNIFFDFMPLHDEEPLENSAMTEAEIRAVSSLRELMVQACEQTPPMVTEEQLLATSWPKNVQSCAADALAIMRVRGKFSEDFDEDTPSIPIG